MNLQEVAEYFETLETLDTIKKGAPGGPLSTTAETADGDKPEGKSRARRKRKQRSAQQASQPATQGQKPPTAEKWCALCAKLGGQPEMHVRSECRKWRVSHNGQSSSQRRDKKAKKNELNTVEELMALQCTIKKMTKKHKSLAKALSKKRRRHDNSSSDDSSSDEE